MKRILCICAFLLSLSGHEAALSEDNVVMPQQLVPSFQVDPFWPKTLPNKWLVGAVAGVAVDGDDHVWIIHRPETLQPNETRAGWRAAPPVLEFDAAGNLLAAWGGPGEGYEWPDLEHGIYVDARNTVWIAGAGQKDAQVLKFTRDGKFLMQIGRSGKNQGSNDTENLGSPSNMVVDEAARELYVADGFNADTGAYRRHWGNYGRRPDDSYFETIGEKLPGRSRAPCRTRTSPVSMIPMRRRSLSSASFMRSGSRMTDLSTSATEPTTEFRCSRRTAASSKKGS
jgi:hypothetical protein